MFKRIVPKKGFLARNEKAWRGITTVGLSDAELENQAAHANLLRLVDAYRTHGHVESPLDPLGLRTRHASPMLRADMYAVPRIYPHGQQVPVKGLLRMPQDAATASVDDIQKHLRHVYCGPIGFEFMHCDAEVASWFAERAETVMDEAHRPSDAALVRALDLLHRSEALDHFMHVKFQTVKRYGLEGAESMLVLMDELFRAASRAGVRDVVLGMPHRGRLNLLVGLLEYPASELFRKVDGHSEAPEHYPGIGDVMSHIAQSVDLAYDAHSLHVSLLHNPSHLEAVNPVAVGKTRAKRDRDAHGDALCVQMHGDSAFAGQGVVSETLQMSNLDLYRVGGSVHVIVNNQIGYTNEAHRSRSTWYASDLMKQLDAPVLHVHADTPSAVLRAAQLAIEYRQKFHRDILIDLIGYRRHGHNELDEPSFTQPAMYQAIRSRKTLPQLFSEQLEADGVCTAERSNALRTSFTEKLAAAFSEAKSAPEKRQPSGGHSTLEGRWAHMRAHGDCTEAIDTGFDVAALVGIARQSVQLDKQQRLHGGIERFATGRVQMVEDRRQADWATAEAMAFGSLMTEGYHVRLSGQDVGRGTFSQRHMLVYDQATGQAVAPLNDLASATGRLHLADSPLSEFAVMGFEYGYSLDDPYTLAIWEAQFGDFFNGAQIVIDNFLASGEEKWWRQSGLVLVLPHGMDGTGPEHCSAKIERFLQLTNGSFETRDHVFNTHTNMHVVNPTTPAQYFHLLRRSMRRDFRKPCVVVGPKVLLRLADARSALDDFAPGTYFRPVLADPTVEPNPSAVERVLLCSGKLYYDLVKLRAAKGLLGKVAIVRLEELAPFPFDDLAAELAALPKNVSIDWVQEEHENQGAWAYARPRFELLGIRPRYIGRGPLSASAVGIGALHKQELADLHRRIFP